MIFPDKKKAVTVILSRMNGAGQEKQAEAKPEESMGEESQALRSIADQILIALDGKSAHDLMLGLQAFMDEYLERDGE